VEGPNDVAALFGAIVDAQRLLGDREDNPEMNDQSST
jgi:hypothetical protein